MCNSFFVSAEHCACMIQNCLAMKGVRIKLEVIQDREPRYVFKIVTHTSTNVSKLRNCIEDLRFYLNVPKVDIIDNGSALELVVITEQIESPQLTRVLRNDKIFKNRVLAHPVGVDDIGRRVIGDIAEYPHLMISGTTKSGKSVALECLLLSLLKYSPEYVNLIICDQTVGLSKFSGLPHLSYPVVQDNETFIKIILLLNEEMERRILIEGTDEYKRLPYIVCVIDEFPAFVSIRDLTKNQLVVDALQSILRRGRHGRVHLVLAANDPKKDNVKIDVSDIPVKMAFRTANFHNSVTAIGVGGAECLREKGEMYFSNGDLKHLQGVYISPYEITLELSLIKISYLSVQYTFEHSFHISDTDLIRMDSEINNAVNGCTEKDDLLPSVILWILGKSEVSTNAIKNEFNIGWNRASHVMEELTKLKIVSEPTSTLPRKVMPHSFEELSPKAQKLLEKSGYFKHEEKTLNIEDTSLFENPFTKYFGED